MLLVCQRGNPLTAKISFLLGFYVNSAKAWSPSSVESTVVGTKMCWLGRHHYCIAKVVCIKDDNGGDQACPPEAWFERACDQSRPGVSVDLMLYLRRIWLSKTIDINTHTTLRRTQNSLLLSLLMEERLAWSLAVSLSCCFLKREHSFFVCWTQITLPL